MYNQSYVGSSWWNTTRLWSPGRQLESTKPPPPQGGKEGRHSFQVSKLHRMARPRGPLLFTKLRDLAGHQEIRSRTYSVASTVLNVPREAFTLSSI